MTKLRLRFTSFHLFFMIPFFLSVEKNTHVATEENTQAEQPATVQETPQENTQEETTLQQKTTETEQQANAEQEFTRKFY